MKGSSNSLEDKVRQLEIQLAKAESEKTKYQKLFEVSSDALSIIDLSSGRFVECNEAAIELHGVESKQNFLDLTPAQISPKMQPCGNSSQELATQYIQDAVAKGPQLFQWVHSRLDGTEFPCLVSLTALNSEGRDLILAVGRDISELVKAQDDLKNALAEKDRFHSAFLEEKEKFEQFVNLAPVGIAINRMEDGAFEYVNQEFGRFTGYSVDELNSMDYWDLTPKEYELQEQEQLESLIEKGNYGPYRKEYIHKNGHRYPVLLSGIKIAKSESKAYIWSVVQDISERAAFEQQINEAKEEAENFALRMELANDSAGIGIWEWNVATNELVWDDWMYKLYGLSKEDFSGAYEAWENSVHPDDIERARAELNDALEGKGVYAPEFRVVHPDGTIKTMKASAQVIRNKSGQATKVIGVNYDITDKVKAIAELKSAKREAENANRAKSDFLANMSHEIRTPMNAILGGLQLLKNSELDDDLNLVLENASFSAQSLLTIINDILDYSKIESNKLDLEVAPFSLLEVLNSVKYDLDSVISNKGIALNVSVPDDFQDGWKGDLVRIKQIVLNLTTNAVKFTDKGGVEINVNTVNFKGKSALEITVADSGIGMSEEAQQRIFERFSQADTSTTRKYGGTGLGMSITVSLVRLMGGEIKLSSELNQGTKVSVTLPLERTSIDSTVQHKKRLSAPNLSGMRILIAEDNKINQVLITSILKPCNAEITLVDNGKLAVDAVKRHKFDLVLMDIHMPEMDGTEAQQLINSFDDKIPIVALTANVMTKDVQDYLDRGFVAHVGKPVDMNNLFGVLNRFAN